MFNKISHKLIATILGVTLVAAATIYTSGYYAVVSGLSSIHHRLHHQHLENIASRVADLYQIHGGWEQLLADDHWLNSLFLSEESKGRINTAPPQFIHPGRQPSPIPSIRLLDANGQELLHGGPTPPNVKFPMVPIQVHGKLVGYLGFPSRLELRHTVENGFIDAALWSMASGAAIAAILAITAALLLARQLLKPVRELSTKVHKLASGDFSQRARIYGDDELAVLAEDVNFLANALQQNQLARQRWINDMAHELRTPLTILSAEVESAQCGIQSSSEDMLASMVQEIDQLNTLINDFRMLAKSDLGELNFLRERIPVRHFFEDYAQKAKSQLKPFDIKLEIEFHTEENLHVFADRKKLKQLLDNLLQNSRRYTNTGGTVRLSIHREERQLVLLWQDSAPGVPEKSLPKLFDRLYRVEKSRNRATGGSGLGLSICKNIVEAQDGTIEANHSELGGLAITCKLPLTA